MTKSSDVEVIVDRMIDYLISINYNQYKTEIASRCVELAEQSFYMSILLMLTVTPICEAFAQIEQQPNICGVVHEKYFDEGLIFAFPIPSQYTNCCHTHYREDKKVGVGSLMAKAVTPPLPPGSPIHGRVSSATTPNQWSISDAAVKEHKYRCDDKDTSSSSAEMSRSSSLDGFFFKKDLQKWSYRHELVDDEDSDDENEVIDREEWCSNEGEEIGYSTKCIQDKERVQSTLDATRAELALVVLYLNKAEARDKICRAIQYSSKFLSNGQPGTAQNVDKSTSLARKVFSLFKFWKEIKDEQKKMFKKGSLVPSSSRNSPSACFAGKGVGGKLWDDPSAYV
ncbi:hypothetical protein EZV62_017018 [Acer yangbiense]|uniref:Uncharacterized protein n=1 Tax=Acer yangbiense TaxID=1000413 RepID=A0A5C7HQU7_9ROSI|nr:hypothetical protein EZV62_017018 [Acer yangbiense]